MSLDPAEGKSSPGGAGTLWLGKERWWEPEQRSKHSSTGDISWRRVTFWEFDLVLHNLVLKAAKKNTDTGVLESSQTTWKLCSSKTTERRQTGGMSEAGDGAKTEQVVQSYTADMAVMQEPLA